MTIRRTTRSLALSAFVAPVLMMSATHGAAASLSDNKTINDGLFAIAAADEIPSARSTISSTARPTRNDWKSAPPIIWRPKAR